MLPAVVPIGGGKGGVGKSSVAAWLAQLLELLGHHAGLMDLDLLCPNAPLVMRRPLVEPQRFSMDSITPALYEGGVEVVSVGLQLPADLPNLLGEAWKTRVVEQYTERIAWRTVPRFIILDLPPGTGLETQVALTQFKPVLGAVVVAIGTEESLMDAKRFIGMVLEMHQRVLGAVENMAWVACPHCNHQVPVHGGLAVARALGVPRLGRLPLWSPAVSRDVILHSLDDVVKAVLESEAAMLAEGGSK